jgi:hypothetical protein
MVMGMWDDFEYNVLYCPAVTDVLVWLSFDAGDEAQSIFLYYNAVSWPGDTFARVVGADIRSV